MAGGGSSGGGWLFDAARGVYRARARGVHTRQLYVNGRRAIRARASVDGEQFAKTETGYEASGAAAAMLNALADASEAEVTSNVEWMGYRCGIAGVDSAPARALVAMDQPCYRNANLRSFPQYDIGAPTTIENALELLDKPAEWYLDRDEGWLYYKPRSHERLPTAMVVAPVLETLVSGRARSRRLSTTFASRG